MIKKYKKIIGAEKFSNDLVEIEHLFPKKVYIQLDTPKSKKYDLLVEVGQNVNKYQLVAVRDCGFYKQNVFATVSGTFVGIEKRFTNSGRINDCVVIENDFKEVKDERFVNLKDEEVFSLTSEEIIKKVQDASVVGAGGGAFPTYIKLESPNIHTILVNGVECEPGSMIDYKNMISSAEEIANGIVLAMKATGAKKAYVCIKKYKIEAISSIEKVINEKFSSYDITIKGLENIYPQGWENMVVKSTLKLNIKGRPTENGIVVINATTAKNIYESCKHNVVIPNRRIVVSGDMFNKNCIINTVIGTPISDLIEIAGGYKNDNDKVVVIGGPMMGTAMLMENAVTNSVTTSIISFKNEVRKTSNCIRCSSCVKSCPAGLAPVLIAKAGSIKDKETVAKLNADKCMSCGTCSYACPSKIDVTDGVKQAKKLLAK